MRDRVARPGPPPPKRRDSADPDVEVRVVCKWFINYLFRALFVFDFCGYCSRRVCVYVCVCVREREREREREKQMKGVRLLVLVSRMFIPNNDKSSHLRSKFSVAEAD